MPQGWTEIWLVVAFIGMVIGVVILGVRAIATICCVPMSGLVWAHHLFASGTPEWLRTAMMITSELLAIPTGIKVFAWTATIWKGRLHLETPMLFAIGGVLTSSLS